jgi:4a-hydroxytetrahydrobiopterin dehydratase
MAYADRKCVACTAGAAPIGRDQARRMLEDLPGWGLSEDGRRIQRKFTFPDFAAAMSFAGRVGEIAESEDHHPEITFGWGYCTVTFWTHKIGGLHENDFLLAAKTNAAFEQRKPRT